MGSNISWTMNMLQLFWKWPRNRSGFKTINTGTSGRALCLPMIKFLLALLKEECWTSTEACQNRTKSEWNRNIQVAFVLQLFYDHTYLFKKALVFCSPHILSERNISRDQELNNRWTGILPKTFDRLHFI